MLQPEVIQNQLMQICSCVSVVLSLNPCFHDADSTPPAFTNPLSCAGLMQAAHSLCPQVQEGFVISLLLLTAGSPTRVCSNTSFLDILGAPGGMQHLGAKASCYCWGSLTSLGLPEILCPPAASRASLPLKPCCADVPVHLHSPPQRAEISSETSLS